MFLCVVTTVYAEQDKIPLREPITPIPDAIGLDDQKIILGRRLFHDPMLSGDGTVSCASCHNLNNAGVDGLPIAIGVKGKLGIRNAPTVLNSSLSFRQFWDGRVATLEEQVSSPLLNPVEMATNWSDVLKYLGSDKNYASDFKKIYRETPSKKSVENAIAEFERSLLTPNGDFDRYLKGDSSAIDEQAKRGYYYFKSYGCISCHQGMAVGGNLYEKLGIVKPYYDETTMVTEPDLGRYNLTGEDEHKFEFKVPSLRNVARTAPYLHDGSIASLEQVVAIMAEYQLGRELSSEHIDDIVSFLETLNGDVDEK
ncbi:MAG: cytochrome-c peroxidase [Gammaproteobacteria bacterium]|nr:cytochrome-c peroxidase [Gammaproteobacteria bacterium]